MQVTLNILDSFCYHDMTSIAYVRKFEIRIEILVIKDKAFEPVKNELRPDG